jgi:RimJ/RimL family protein N-acetyltransferase
MITLQPMTDADFHIYLEKAIPEYAREKVQAGNWSETEALERSRKEYEGYLPQGAQTAENFLFMLVNEAGEKVGFLWYALQPKQPGWGFIYDFEVYAPFRRRGYASQALALLDQDARRHGLNKLELHVFGHNLPARELYKKAGFVESNIMMLKQL